MRLLMQTNNRRICTLVRCVQHHEKILSSSSSPLLQLSSLSLSSSYSSSLSSSSLSIVGISRRTFSSPTHTTNEKSNSKIKHNTKKKKNSHPIKSLALCTYFKHPDFDMKQYEILSRATAFLLSVDPREYNYENDPYGHLHKAEVDRKIRDFQRTKKFTPPSPTSAKDENNKAQDMGWLEFIPKEHRPNVHILCSSHVVSPFLWKDYYPHDWLSHVRQEHCTYTLEILDRDNKENPQENSLKFALHNTPIHHPEGRDIAIMHLKDEESALDIMRKQGVDILYLRDLEKIFKKGEHIYFEGFEVAVPDTADGQNYENDSSRETTNDNSKEEDNNDDNDEEDYRVFLPYTETGTLSFHTNDRFFATTPKPLPEGLCGAPAIDVEDNSDNDDNDNNNEDGGVIGNSCCGIVEGIVPVTHTDERLAGSAAFLPSFVMKPFIDYAERYMVEQMMPKDLFQAVVRAKATNTIGGGVFDMKQEGSGDGSGKTWEEAYDIQIEKLKKQYSKEEMDALLWNINRERDEVLDIMNKEGGDMDEIIARVRAKTLATKQMIMEKYKKGEIVSPYTGSSSSSSAQTQDNIVEAEVVKEKNPQN